MQPARTRSPSRWGCWSGTGAGHCAAATAASAAAAAAAALALLLALGAAPTAVASPAVAAPAPAAARRLLAAVDKDASSIIQQRSGHPHALAKRSFFDLQCKGVYDKSIFARLDRICEDCYNLFREPQLHSLCRSNCFTSPYFKGCLESLLLQEEEESLTKMIDFLG